MTYSGALKDISGQIIPLQNIPLDNVLGDGVGTPIATVNDLFILGGDSRRYEPLQHEVAYKPIDAGADRFRDGTDVCIVVGSPGVAISVRGTDAKTFHPTGFGFAFRGFTAGDVPLSNFELHKNIEWKTASNQGLPMTPAVVVGDDMHKRAIQWLDANIPNWWTITKQTMNSGLGMAATAAFAGAGRFMSKRLR
jgi:hypothetical protein